MNLKKGGADFISAKISEWMFHPTEPNVDVAVLPFAPSREFDYLAYPITSIIDKNNTQQIGIGDEVFVTGLFTKHSGVSKNIPIVRLGHVVAMPEEPVEVKEGSIEAYLIEARSFGGLSGSPVFVHLGLVRYINGLVKTLQGSGFIFYLLGIIRGHWNWTEEDYDSVPDVEMNSEAVNIGIAIVTPASKILEVIDQPKLLEIKRQDMAAMKKQNLPVED
jgi:hypothetical protein